MLDVHCTLSNNSVYTDKIEKPVASQTDVQGCAKAALVDSLTALRLPQLCESYQDWLKGGCPHCVGFPASVAASLATRSTPSSLKADQTMLRLLLLCGGYSDCMVAIYLSCCTVLYHNHCICP